MIPVRSRLRQIRFPIVTMAPATQAMGVIPRCWFNASKTRKNRRIGL